METVMEIYERTYRNCVFYRNEGHEIALLNEIGVLRGIFYCLEAIVGEKNVYRLVDYAAFVEMINEQQRMKNEGAKV